MRKRTERLFLPNFLKIALNLWFTKAFLSLSYIQGCWKVLSPTSKETSYSDRIFLCSYTLFIIIIGGILVLYIYIYICITRLASNEIFSPSNKIHREVGRAKDLSAPRYSLRTCLCSLTNSCYPRITICPVENTVFWGVTQCSVVEIY
jgi:hypothetical protein